MKELITKFKDDNNSDTPVTMMSSNDDCADDRPCI